MSTAAVQKKETCIRSGISLRYSVSKMNAEAKRVLLDFVKEIVTDDGIVIECRGIQNRSIGVTLEYARRNSIGANQRMGNADHIMSEKTMKWAGLAMRDPNLSIAKFRQGVFKGINHTFGSIFADGYDHEEKKILSVIESIPTHEMS